MPVNFPSSPTLNQTYSLGSKTWIWNGVAWDLKTSNSAFIQANAAFEVANSAAIAANTPSHVANSAAIYANGAFAVANNEAAVNLTQNNSIDASFTAANSAGVYANSAFTRANNSLNANTGGTVNGDLTISGNLSVLGNTFSVSATTLIANDTIIVLGANNYTSDLLDIGFAAHYNDTVNAHTGFIRDHGTKEWQLFEGYTPEIGANNQIDINDPSFKIATLNANIHATKILLSGIDLLPYVNTAFNTANSAFLAANTQAGVNDTQNTNISFAWYHANSAFDKANTGGSVAVGDSPPPAPTANSLWWQSNTATLKIYYDDGTSLQWVDASPAAYSLDQLARDTANAAFIHANAAFIQANTGGGGGADQYARDTANASFVVANSSAIAANTPSHVANSAAIAANTPSHVANSASVYANGAFAAANNEAGVNASQNNSITASFDTANAAFNQANTDVTNISITSDTYGNATHIPIVTVSANGRINTISTIAAAGGGGGTDQYARNHANAAYGQANTAFTTASSASAAALGALNDHPRIAFTGRLPTYRQNYQGHGSGWTYDFTSGHTSGSFARMPIGGGHNETDTPNQWVWNKHGERFSSAPGEISMPFEATDPRVFYKKLYRNNVRDSWSQREEIWRSENITSSVAEQIGQSQLVHGMNGAHWLDQGIYANGNTPNTTNTLNTTGSYVDPGTTSSVTVSNNEKIFFALNGQRSRLTYTTDNGWTSGTVDGNDYGGSFTEILNDTGGTRTFYYSYYCQGSDPARTFVKVFKRIENASFSTTSAVDAALNRWNYYWRNDEFFGTNGGSGIVSPTTPIYFSSQRLHRIWYDGPSKPAPLNTRPYSICVKLNLENPTGVLQNLWQAGDGVNTTNAGMIFQLNTAATGERRINCTMYSAAAALVTNLKVWQFAGDGAEDVNFHWSWNPSDPIYPGRLYVNDKLVFCTATNPLASGLGFFGVGSMASGTANGFQGWLNQMSFMPESWGNHIPQGSVALDWDAIIPTILAANYNGTHSVNAAGRAVMPRASYIRSGTTFGQGAYIGNASCNPYAAAGSFTASCVTTADSTSVSFGNTVGGWINPSGVYLVTGTNIRATRNAYCTLTFGDKSFSLEGQDDNVTATASGTTTLTFTRINGGHRDGFFNVGMQITQVSNAAPLTKTNNSAQTLTNCLAGVNSTTYLAFGAFPNITFTAIAGSSGDDTLAGSPYIRTNTSSNAAMRNVLCMLGVGKKPTITGAGIPAVSASVDHTYIDDVYWNHYATGAHLVILSQNKTGNATASVYTIVYVPGNRSSFDAELDNTGGDSSYITDYNYSSLTPQRDNSVGPQNNLSPNDGEWEIGLGILKSWRLTPPKGLYDSGIFRATASGFFRRMNITYGCMVISTDYGSVPDMNRVTTHPTITYQTTSARANGLTFSTTAGNYYRIVVIPLSTIISGI